MTLFARVQRFPEPSNSFVALIFGLAGRHVRRKIVIEHPALFKRALPGFWIKRGCRDAEGTPKGAESEDLRSGA